MTLNDSVETKRILSRFAAGDRGDISGLFGRHRDWLRSFVQARLDARLARRLDASDVVQETILVAHRRLGDFVQRKPLPFRLWLLKMTMDRLSKLRRRHFAACRSVVREITLADHSTSECHEPWPVTSDDPLRQNLRAEITRQVAQAMERLDDADRTILVLRHVKGLSHPEIGDQLQISPDAARKRHGRALIRLRSELATAGFKQDDVQACLTEPRTI